MTKYGSSRNARKYNVVFSVKQAVSYRIWKRALSSTTITDRIASYANAVQELPTIQPSTAGIRSDVAIAAQKATTPSTFENNAKHAKMRELLSKPRCRQ